MRMSLIYFYSKRKIKMSKNDSLVGRAVDTVLSRVSEERVLAEAHRRGLMERYVRELPPERRAALLREDNDALEPLGTEELVVALGVRNEHWSDAFKPVELLEAAKKHYDIKRIALSEIAAEHQLAGGLRVPLTIAVTNLARVLKALA